MSLKFRRNMHSLKKFANRFCNKILIKNNFIETNSMMKKNENF